MRIKLDDTHYLESDPLNVWISQEYKSSKGKIYTRNVTGYYRRVDDVIEDYIDKKILSSKATSLTALKKEIKSIKKQVSEWKGLVTIKDMNSTEETKKKGRGKK